MSVQAPLRPPSAITVSTGCPPAVAACTGCTGYSEEEHSQSEDMLDALRARAAAHARSCRHPVTITRMSVLTIAPAGE